MIHIYCPDTLTAHAAVAYLKNMGKEAEVIKTIEDRDGLQIMLAQHPDDLPDIEKAARGKIAVIEYDPADWDDLCGILHAAIRLDKPRL